MCVRVKRGTVDPRGGVTQRVHEVGRWVGGERAGGRGIMGSCRIILLLSCSALPG